MGPDLDARRRGGIDIALDRQLAGGVRAKDRLQIRLQRRRVGQGRRDGIGIPLQHPVGEDLDPRGADEVAVAVLGAHRLGPGDQPVVVDRSVRPAEVLRLIELEEVRAHGERAARQQGVPKARDVVVDPGVLHGGDAGPVQPAGDLLRRPHQGRQIGGEHVRRADPVARRLVDRAVRLAGRVHPDQGRESLEGGGEARSRIADHLAGVVLRQGEAGAIIGVVVAIVAEQHHRPVGRGVVEGGPEGRVGGARLVAVREVPLLHRHPLARRQVVSGDAGLDEGRQTVEVDRLRVQAADVEIGDAGRVNMGVDEARQHQAAAGILDRRRRADPGARAGRRADEGDPAVLDRQRLGGLTGRGFR